MRTRTDPGGRTWAGVPGADASSWREIRWHPVSLLPGDLPGDYELEYRRCFPGDTPDTGWYLYGGGHFGRHAGRRLDDALTEVHRWISGCAYENLD